MAEPPGTGEPTGGATRGERGDWPLREPPSHQSAPRRGRRGVLHPASWLRQGPPSAGDTVPLTAVSSAVAAGDLRAAASVTSLPNPRVRALDRAAGGRLPVVGGRTGVVHRASDRGPARGARRRRRRRPLRHDRNRAPTVVPIAGRTRPRVLAGAGPRQPGPPPGRERRLRGPAGRTAGLPGFPARGPQRHRAALPSRHRQPGTRPRRAGPRPPAAVGTGRSALRCRRAHQAVRRTSPPAGPGGGRGSPGPDRPRRLVFPRVRCRHPPLPVRLPSGDPGEPQRVQRRGRAPAPPC